MFGNHLDDIRGLMDSGRYQGKKMHCRRSVAEHSWFVSKISHGLALWEKNKFHNEVNIERVLFLAINHDVIEAYTGDIMSTMKSRSETFREGLEIIENEMLKEKILPTLPQSWRPDYIDMHEEISELRSLESRIVKASDVLDRVFECMDEITRANTYPFEDILKLDIRKLYDMNLMSVNYFLKYSIKDIRADEYIPEDIKESLEKIDFSPYF